MGQRLGEGNWQKKLSRALTVFLPIVIILFSTAPLIYNLNFYESLFIKNHVDVKEGRDSTLKLFDYFKSADSKLKINSFNKEEKTHLEEVRVLWQALTFIFITALFLWIIFLNEAKNKRSIFLKGGILTIILLLLSAAIPFDYLFEAFHKIFFIQPWKFAPNSVLIMTYPQGFFYGFASAIWLNSFLLAVLMVVLSSIRD